MPATTYTPLHPSNPGSYRAYFTSRRVIVLAFAVLIVFGGFEILLHSYDLSPQLLLPSDTLEEQPVRGHAPLTGSTTHVHDWPDDYGAAAPLAGLPPVRHRNVAVASSFGFHFDVYMAFAKTLGNVMDAAPDARNTISIFAPDFQLGFQDVVDELGLWTHGGVRGRPEDLIPALNATTGDGGIDLVVFGTCEVE